MASRPAPEVTGGIAFIIARAKQHCQMLTAVLRLTALAAYSSPSSPRS